jgi:hypothetical protein
MIVEGLIHRTAGRVHPIKFNQGESPSNARNRRLQVKRCGADTVRNTQKWS